MELLPFSSGSLYALPISAFYGGDRWRTESEEEDVEEEYEWYQCGGRRRRRRRFYIPWEREEGMEEEVARILRGGGSIRTHDFAP